MRAPECVVVALFAVVGLSPAGRAQETTAPIQVYAASSLTNVIQALAEDFAEDTGWPRPRTVFAGSSRLALQIRQGAPADVILTADEDWMDALAEAGHLLEGSQTTLLVNHLVTVVPAGAAFVPASPGDLTDQRVRLIAVANTAVPAGRRAREALAHHGLLEQLEPRFVRSPNVRAALALVARAEVDAGIVYGTDARASSDVIVAFTFDRSAHAPIRYPIALTQRSVGRPAARAFFDYLRGEHARAVFAAAGFRIPGMRRTGHAALPRPAERSVAPGASTRADWLDPLLLSAWVAVLSLALSVVPALFFGWLLARKRFPGKALLSTLMLVPLVLPPVVTGYVLLSVFGRNGPLAPLLDAVGLQVAFSRHGAVVAAGVVGFPLLIIMTRTAIEAVDARYEQLAETLGMHPLLSFVRITLPMALPGILAGCVLAFARALGEFGATAILASDVPGETRTLALAVYALYEEPGGATATRVLVAISVGLCLIALVGYERLTAAQQRRLADRPR